MEWFFGMSLTVGGAFAVLSLIRRRRRHVAKIRDWLFMLGHDVIRATKECPRSHMLGAILMQPSFACECGPFTFMVKLSEVMPMNGPGLVRIVELGHVCPYCGRISTRLSFFPGWKDEVDRSKSTLGRRLEDGTSFFDLVELMSREQAEKTGTLSSDDMTGLAVPHRSAARTTS